VTGGFIPYGKQYLDEADIDAVTQVLRGDWLTQGPQVGWFELAFAAKVGTRHAIACANGTAALHLALLALDIGPRDAVVVPSITFLATANAARYVGAEVAFADVDAQTGLMRRADAEAAIASAEAQGWRVRAIIPVHLSGQPADMAGLAALAAERGITLVEDACHAIGTRLADRDGAMVAIGACDRSTMACFSFHPVKTLATGEGGMVTTNDDALAARLRRLVSHGMVRDASNFLDAQAATGADGKPNPWYYEMLEIGFNYRMTDIQAALGRSQLDKLDHFLTARRKLVALYDTAFAPLAPRLLPVGRVSGAEPGWHLYPVRLDFAGLGMDRSTFMGRLRAAGIGSQVHYIPVHRQPYYQQRYEAQELAGAEDWYRHCLSLPLYAGMSMADLDRVVAAVSRILAA
jgi:UDP-4-amino-4,6-dideoxy-N-acetyl-beta-L-altrosamine transaminase